MIIKVCGMRDAQNIRDVEALGIDWIGMIFWPKSKRYVAEVPSYLPEHLKKVGVFVDSTLDDILQHISDYQLDIIQLHGQESPDFAKALKPHTIIKAFNIEKADDLLQTEKYKGIADYFLFDTKGKMVGGNGQKFDWSVLTTYQGKTPFLSVEASARKMQSLSDRFITPDVSASTSTQDSNPNLDSRTSINSRHLLIN